MYRFLRNTAFVLIAAAALLSSCSGKDERTVIPRSQLARIYAEMLVTDQWITTTPGMRMIADTSLVYIPILEKYGYDLDDYLKSVDVYMEDPERFARILRKSGDIIGKQIEDAEIRLEEHNRLAALPKIKVDLDMKEFFPFVFDEPYAHYYDSLSFEPDSALMIYRLIPVETGDTLFDGIRMMFRSDTSAVADTSGLMMADTAKISVGRKVMELIPDRRVDSSGVVKAARIRKADNPLTGKRKWESEE